MVVTVPVPEATSRANILVTAGKAKYDATKKALVRSAAAVGRRLGGGWVPSPPHVPGGGGLWGGG